MMTANELTQVTVFRRDSLPELRSVVVDGTERNLGIHKDFRRHPVLDRFIPADARLAVAWVHLDPRETLETHVHPIATMIIVCAGQGRLVGDLEATISEGDIIAVPRGCAHGFIGAGDHGYWALSIQFEAHGLYERPDAPLAAFGGRGMASFEALVRENERHMEEHKSNVIFRFVESDRIANAACRGKLIDCIQVWSGYFQKVIMSRMVFGSDARFLSLAREHFSEEYGHDVNLASSRHGRSTVVWDPALEAYSSWFVSQMQCLGDAEKTVLVHLVLEGCSTVFHRVAHPIMRRFNETDHFAVHDLADDGHLEMCLDLLKGLPPEIYERCLRVQTEGWAMFNALSTRMTEIAEAAE